MFLLIYIFFSISGIVVDVKIVLTEVILIVSRAGPAYGVDEVGCHHHPQGEGHQGQSCTHHTAAAQTLHHTGYLTLTIVTTTHRTRATRASPVPTTLLLPRPNTIQGI